MKVTLKHIFQFAITQINENLIEASKEITCGCGLNDYTIKDLSDNIEAHGQIKELAEFFEHCSNIPFEEVLCRCFEEEENE